MWGCAGWCRGAQTRTLYPAQVQVEWYRKCEPLKPQCAAQPAGLCCASVAKILGTRHAGEGSHAGHAQGVWVNAQVLWGRHVACALDSGVYEAFTRVHDD